MRNSLYPKLAAQNIKKNGKYYLPYIITGTMSVCMFFIVFLLQNSNSLNNITGGSNLKILLAYALWVSALLFTVFLFYNQSFLNKRRKTEFGLYSVLGMEKKHICRMCMFESLYVSIICITIGIAFGLLFSKLAFLALLKILNFSTPLAFEFSWAAIGLTSVLFIAIYTLIFFNTVRQVYSSKTVELLQSSKVGEKEQKAKWLVTIIGILALGSGYTIALTTKNPISAIPLFTLAVVLVCIGTYCLFSSGSIHFLKLLKKDKNYYYKTKHFVSVSSMIYRMKQNAIGLGNICIFCTAVLVTISTTVSLYFGMEDVLRSRFPRNITVELSQVSDISKHQAKNVIDEKRSQFGIDTNNEIEYSYYNLMAIQKSDNSFSARLSEVENSSVSSQYTNIQLIDLNDYNKLSAQNISLSQDEVLLYEVNGEISGNSINFGDYNVKIKGRIDNLDMASGQMAMLIKTYYIVIPNDEMAKKLIEGVSYGEETDVSQNFYYGFDTNASPESQFEFTENVVKDLDNPEYGFKNVSSDCAEESREDFYSLYGGLLFIGIFFGIVFISATVLIIYYKQISEGYDDKERFQIMQKVGMSKSEIKKSINSQVLTVFFLPLVTAFIHMAVAFPIMTKLLACLNLTKVSVFVVGLLTTAVVFAIVYTLVYIMTAKVYYKIVN